MALERVPADIAKEGGVRGCRYLIVEAVIARGSASR